MTLWDKKKKEYYDRISSYDIDNESLINLDKINNGLNISKMILNPRTQKEMDFCDSLFLVLSDLTKMQYEMNFLSYDEDDNEFVRYFSNYVNKVLNDESLEDELFLINIDMNNSLNIEINTDVISEYDSRNNNASYFIEYYSKIMHDLIPAIMYGDLLDTALNRKGLNVNNLFRALLIKSINYSYLKEKDREKEEVDKEKLLEFFTKLFNSFHQLTKENMKLERRK